MEEKDVAGVRAAAEEDDGDRLTLRHQEEEIGHARERREQVSED